VLGALATVALGGALVLSPRLSGRATMPAHAAGQAAQSPTPPEAVTVAPTAQDPRYEAQPVIIRHEAPAPTPVEANDGPSDIRTPARRKIGFVRPAVVAPKVATTTTTSSAKPADAQPGRKVSCDEPFYLAPDGVRRLRPECQ
jgi:hypothetical protein